MLTIVLSLCLAVVAQSMGTVSAGCVCANTAVRVRSGASTSYSRLGTVSTGSCVILKSTSGRRNQGYYWRNVDYRGQNAWVADSGTWWEDDSSCSSGPVLSESGSSNSGGGSNGGSGSSGSCPNIISRASWGAQSPTSLPVSMRTTPRYVFIHHSATPGCSSVSECKTRVKSFQTHHIRTNGWSDIGYSFVVGEDGNVYEGRGWGKVGAHTLGYNSIGIGICIAGDFTNRLPNSAALTAVKSLIECGVRNGNIRSDYTLRGHRDMGETTCPGNRLYDSIQSWPHYS